MLTMAGGILLAAWIIGYVLRLVWPVSGLKFVEERALCGFDLPPQSKILDVRDASYYEECHLNGAINISLGRLPFVWAKELSSSDPVLIVADRRSAVIKAARILRRRGFRQLYALRGEACREGASRQHCLEKEPAC